MTTFSLDENQISYLRDVLGIRDLILPEAGLAPDALSDVSIEPEPSINLRIRGSIATARILVLWARVGERALSGAAENLANKMLAAMKLEPSEILWVEWTPPSTPASAPEEARLLLSASARRPVLLFGQHTVHAFLAQANDKAFGQWLSKDDCRALATFSPEEILDSPEGKKLAWTHLQFIMKDLSRA